MWKPTIYLMMVFLLVEIISAGICEDKREIYQNCTMLTPSLSCITYNYTVYYQNTTQRDGTLKLLSQDIYQFNFTEPKGDYIVRLCDGSTREIRVKGEDSMILGAIIILPLMLTVIFLVGAAFVPKEYGPIKALLFILSIIPFFTAMQFGMNALVEVYGMPNLQEAMGDTVYWVSIVLFVLILFFLLYLIYLTVTSYKQNRKERIEE